MTVTSMCDRSTIDGGSIDALALLDWMPVTGAIVIIAVRVGHRRHVLVRSVWVCNNGQGETHRARRFRAGRGVGSVGWSEGGAPRPSRGANLQ